jgi:hypothetical protein
VNRVERPRPGYRDAIIAEENFEIITVTYKILWVSLILQRKTAVTRSALTNWLPVTKKPALGDR